MKNKYEIRFKEYICKKEIEKILDNLYGMSSIATIHSILFNQKSEEYSRYDTTIVLTCTEQLIVKTVHHLFNICHKDISMKEV